MSSIYLFSKLIKLSPAEARAEAESEAPHIVQTNGNYRNYFVGFI